MLKIGNLSIQTPVLLAPMAGVTDYSFRILCKEQGAGIVYSEFVSAHGIIRKNDKTLDMIRFSETERPIGIQIFGDSPEVMADAAQFVANQFNPDIIDINYGCPVPKITKRGAGSAALKDLCLMEEITSAVVESVPQLPVTVKMRAGWDSQSIVVEKAGNQLENAGVKAITLHPRTTKQHFSGTSDWSLIKTLKQAVSIPIIGNGDINSVDGVKRMFEDKISSMKVARKFEEDFWDGERKYGYGGYKYIPNLHKPLADKLVAFVSGYMNIVLLDLSLNRL